MIQLINEAGIGGWFVILFIIAGVAATTTVGRRWGRPGSIAGVWAVVVLAAGVSGFGAGQRMTDRAFNGRRGEAAGTGAVAAADPNLRVAMLSRGTAEAAANLMLAGQGALLVMLVGGLMVFFRKKDAPGATSAAASPVPVKAT